MGGRETGGEAGAKVGACAPLPRPKTATGYTFCKKHPSNEDISVMSLLLALDK